VRRAVPALVGAVAAVLVLLLTGADGRTAPASGVAVPEELAGYSHLTGSVSASPPGPAVALWQHGYGVEFLDFPQAVVLGAGGDTYRRVDVAEGRAGGETQGDPAPMLLSPDGTRVAVGDHDLDRPDVVVVDLATGDTTSHPLPAGRSVVPVAWSADGRTVASLLSDEPTNPYSGQRITGDLGLVDTTPDASDDSARVLDAGGSATAAAFSPDGSELAVERARRLSIVDLADGRERELEDVGVLAGPAAWSPDGRLLAVTTTRASPVAVPTGVDDPGIPTGLAFVDPTGRGGRVPDPLPLPLAGPGRVLGWSGPDGVLAVLEPDGVDPCCGPDSQTLSRVPLDGTEPRPLMRMSDLGSYGIGRFQLAASYAEALQVVDPDEVDRGPWPSPLRGVLCVAAGLVAWLLARAVLCRRLA
jgi:hypothetical protein